MFTIPLSQLDFARRAKEKHLVEEIVSWCNTNCTGYFTFRYSFEIDNFNDCSVNQIPRRLAEILASHPIFEFDDLNDAVMFKLTWASI